MSGIKARTARGSFGRSWWGRRWISVLESFGGNRLGRGRAYARAGRVLDIRVAKGRVTANVQGARARPYQVTLRLPAYGRREQAALMKNLSGRALYAAKLLAGEMPPEIEDLFRQSGTALFPRRLSDLRSSCTCPDRAAPCKHVAAVCYLLAEELDRDPALLLKLRGLALDRLLSGLPAGRPRRKAAAPVSADPAAFWGRADAPRGAKLDLRPPPVDAPLLKQLGSFPFWRGEDGLTEALEDVHKTASLAALELLIRLRA